MVKNRNSLQTSFDLLIKILNLNFETDLPQILYYTKEFMKKVVFFALIVASSMGYSQKLSVTLGGETDVVLNSMQGKDETSFFNYFLTYENKKMSNEFDLNFLALNGAIEENEKHILIPNIGKDKLYFEKLIDIEGQLYLFSRLIDEKKYTNTLYATKVNKNGTLAKETKLMDQIVAKDVFLLNNYGTYDFILSQDLKSLLIVRFAPYGHKAFSCKLIDENLDQIWQKDFELLETYEYTDYSNFILTNEGDIYFKGQVKKEKSQRVKGKPGYLNYLYSYNYKKASLTELKLELNDIFVMDNELKLINDKLIFAGLYANKYYPSAPAFGLPEFIIDGAFWITLNETCTKVLKMGSVDLASKVTQPKEELKNQRLKNISILSDGGIVIISERFLFKGVSAMKTGSSSDRGGISQIGTNMNYYYHDNILIIKMHEQTQLSWMKQIQKSTISIDDPGVGSFTSLIDKNNIHIIYNKQKELLDIHDSVYKKPKTKLRMIKNPITWHTSFDVTGEIIENDLFFKEKTDLIFSPYQSFTTISNEIIFLSCNKEKNRFGKISIVN